MSCTKCAPLKLPLGALPLGCSAAAEQEILPQIVSKWNLRQTPTAFGVGKPQAVVTKVGFEDTVFRLQIGDDLLLVTLEPAGDHGNEYIQDHGVSSGWKL
jgi:hypothetical protein